jgi:hypothetical protein
MNDWLYKMLQWLTKLYLGLAAFFACVYLAVFIPIAVVLEIMDTLNLGHFDEHKINGGWTWAITSTIFLLVLKTSADIDDIKAKVDQAE